jgi:hypothetical protein
MRLHSIIWHYFLKISPPSSHPPLLLQPLPKIAGKDGHTYVLARFDHAGITKMVESEQQDPYGA